MEFFLEKKLDEEVQEFHSDKSIEELADILEVIYALCDIKGYAREQLENIRMKKEQTNGAFKNGIFLEYIDE